MLLSCGGGVYTFYRPCAERYKVSCNPVDDSAAYSIDIFKKHVNQTNIQSERQLTKWYLSTISVCLCNGWILGGGDLYCDLHKLISPLDMGGL